MDYHILSYPPLPHCLRVLSTRPDCLSITFHFKLFRLGFVGSPTSLSSSRSRTTSSEEDADDGYENDDEDSVGSARDIMDRSYSAQSENDSPKFHNHPKALYKFISEEDSSRTEVKFTLGFTDRLKLPNELKHILRVLYTRKNSDKTARSFLRELPPGYMEEALGSDLLVFWSSGSPISAFC